MLSPTLAACYISVSQTASAMQAMRAHRKGHSIEAPEETVCMHAGMIQTCTLRQSHPGIAFDPALNNKIVITNLPPTVVPLALLISLQPFSSGAMSAFSSGGK